MPEKITISAPSRLHFGLFSVGDAVARKFGGVGLMIDAPRTVVTASPSDHFKITGPGRVACARGIENWFATTQRSLAKELEVEELSLLPVKLEIEHLPPRHSGFGTGTQLALASAWAITRLLGLATPSPVELAAAVGRGKRSAIGSHGFGRGGFLVDRGKLEGEPLAPLDFHTEFPEPWSIVTVIHNGAKGLSGDLESDAFRSLTATTEAQRNEMIEIVRGEIIPGVLQSNFDQFSNGVFEFGRRSGMLFAQLQNGAYNGAQIELLIDQIRNFGVKAVGQSSWGPCVFAITSNDERAEQLVDFLRTGHDDDCEFQIAKADNRGAKVISPEAASLNNG